MPRIIHTSDLQLGARRWYFDDDAQARYAQARIDCIERINAVAEAHGAAFVCCAGDVFESNQVDPRTVLRACDAWARSPVPWLLLPGNHDPLDAASVFTASTFKSQAPEQVRVLTDSAPMTIPGVDGLEVVGAPWTSKEMLHDSVADLCDGLPARDGGLRVLLAHGPTDVTAPQAADRPETIRIAAAEAARDRGLFDYLALGDRHSVTRVGSSGAIWYSGSPLVTDFRDPDPNQALLVDLAPGETPRVTALPVGDWWFIEAEHRLGSAADIDGLADWLTALPTPARRVLRLTLSGSLAMAEHARLRALLDAAGQRLAVLDLDDDALVALPSDLDREDLGLTGYLGAAWQELAESARGGDGEARDALALAFRLARAQG